MNDCLTSSLNPVPVHMSLIQDNRTTLISARQISKRGFSPLNYGLIPSAQPQVSIGPKRCGKHGIWKQPI